MHNSEEDRTTSEPVSEEFNEDVSNIMMQTQDPHSVGDNITESAAFMNVIKANIGTGMLSMPIAFKYSGIWLGLFIICVAGLISTFCMKILLEVSQSITEEKDLDRSHMDYTNTVFYVLKYGPRKFRNPKGKLKHTVNFFLIVTQLGFCCVYILFITQNIQSILEEWAPSLNRNRFLIGFVISLLLLPFSLITDMSKFSIPATLANLTTSIALVLIIIYCLLIGKMHSWQELTNPIGIREVLIAFSIAIFAFEGISLMLPLRNKMKKPDFFLKWNGSLYTGMITVVLSNCLIGWIGYFRFGKDTRESIPYNIPETPIWVAFVKPLLIFAILVSFLLQFYVPAAIFSRLMEKIPYHRNATSGRRKWNLKIMRLISVILIYFLSMIIPHLDLLLSLIGALCSSMLAIIIPPALALVHKWPSRQLIHQFNIRYLYPYCILIIFGLFSFIGGTIATILQIIDVNNNSQFVKF